MPLDNDARGWIMTCISGIACVFGAGIICIDVLVRQIPGKKHFRVQDSNTFLSASLSLSAGVMLFSALYSILPSSSSSFESGGLSPKGAAWALIGCFLGGVIGIQIISRLIHRMIPSHVVDCDHTHEEDGQSEGHPHDSHPHGRIDHPHPHTKGRRKSTSNSSEDTPLLSRTSDHVADGRLQTTRSDYETVTRSTANGSVQQQMSELDQPNMPPRLGSRIVALVRGDIAPCQDRDGQCYGFSDVCRNECFRRLQARFPPSSQLLSDAASRRQPLQRSSTMPYPSQSQRTLQTRSGPDGERAAEHETEVNTHTNGHIQDEGGHVSHAKKSPELKAVPEASTSDPELGVLEEEQAPDDHQHHNQSQTHHHHVPENAFLSIGLQTSIAIALHKVPEGFITFATNHANPTLGFAVFVALFVHNVTEGFALCLPLYLALNSRWKAVLTSSILGGLSQPLGAFVAAMWFKVARRTDTAPSETVYGAMFAVTAGIMTTVALQLFSEGLGLNHSRSLCIGFAFVGMGILGFSYALTAK